MYIDWSRLAGKYPDVANKFNATVANSHYIPAAQGEVDAYLGKRYTVPLSPCPDMVSDLVVDVAYYKMTYRSENQEKLKEYIDERLQGLACGSIALTTSGGIVPDLSNYAWTSNSYHTSFGPDGAENWCVSSQWIDDIREARGRL